MSLPLLPALGEETLDNEGEKEQCIHQLESYGRNSMSPILCPLTTLYYLARQELMFQLNKDM